MIQVCQVYILMGQLDECRKFASQKSTNQNLIRDLPVNELVLAYFAGEVNADEYLMAAESSGATTFRLLMVGMTELAKGNRRNALDRLHQVERDGLFHAWEYVLALAIADRMERDASWPGWLPSDAAESDDIPAGQ